jgi:hypothetical protein
MRFRPARRIPLYHPSKNEVMQGEVEIMIQLLTVKRADQKPVGRARDQPNRDPELRQPVRATLNPFDPLGSLAIILGRALRSFPGGHKWRWSILE